MNKKKTVEQLLPCYPERFLNWETNRESGRVTVFRPKYYSKFARKIMSPFLKTDYFSVKLDELGSSVWRLCDGKHTVEEIGKELAKQYGPEIEPIYERLAIFLIQLFKGKFIEIRCPDSN